MPSPPRFFVVLFVAGLIIFHHPFRQATVWILRLPFQVVDSAVEVLVKLPRLPIVDREQERLQAQLIQNELELVKLREVLRQTKEAQTLLSGWADSRGIIAQVIGRSPIPTQQTVLLNKGSGQGVSVNTIVLDASGLVGKVIELHASTALVLLLTDAESRLAAQVERSRETGLLVGNGRGGSMLVYLDDEADIQIGDRVVTSNFGGSLPKGLFLGRVLDITRDELSGSAAAVVAPAAALSELEEVLCLELQLPKELEASAEEKKT